MWKPFRRSAKNLDSSRHPEELVWLRGLRAFTGALRGVVYDVPVADRPVRELGRLKPRGSAAWDRFLEAREQMDSGELTLALALRPLDDEEARLVVDWGCTYANAFLLVEPSVHDCDFTDPANPWAVELAQIIRHAATDPAADAGSRGTSAIVELLRRAFGAWVFWTAPPPHGSVQRVRLRPLNGPESLQDLLLTECRALQPQDAFDHELVRLLVRERELVWGPVPRARSVFRTRLGMPVLIDAFAPDRGVRALVNRGTLSVREPSHSREVARGRDVAFGPGRPVPSEWSDNRFAELEVV